MLGSDKFTMEEIKDLFGEEMPIRVLYLLTDESRPVEDVRAEIISLAQKWRARTPEEIMINKLRSAYSHDPLVQSAADMIRDLCDYQDTVASLLQETTISSSGDVITIDCSTHGVRDNLLGLLGGDLAEGRAEAQAEERPEGFAELDDFYRDGMQGEEAAKALSGVCVVNADRSITVPADKVLLLVRVCCALGGYSPFMVQAVRLHAAMRGEDKPVSESLAEAETEAHPT